MPARSKYRAVPTVLDGERFHSKAEAARWAELKLLQRARRIKALERQPLITLIINGITVGRWIGDFTYIENGVRIYEDHKGVDNALSRFKRKVVEAYAGIEVRLTGAAAKKRAA